MSATLVQEIIRALETAEAVEPTPAEPPASEDWLAPPPTAQPSLTDLEVHDAETVAALCAGLRSPSWLATLQSAEALKRSPLHPELAVPALSAGLARPDA